jgi:hypothetical protein
MESSVNNLINFAGDLGVHIEKEMQFQFIGKLVGPTCRHMPVRGASVCCVVVYCTKHHTIVGRYLKTNTE